MYKAFVSSTFEDLHLHRAEVISTLQAAGFQVDPMENWQADREAPHKFSAERLNGCKVCILIVAFRRGHIPPSKHRSITQIEYDEAKRRRIDVLPFLLSEQTSVGDSGWNPKFDERASDVEVSQWRNTLRQAHGVGEFGNDPKSIRVEAALVRWVVQTESDNARRFRRTAAFTLSGLFILLALGSLYVKYVYETPQLRDQFHSKYLAFHDPVAFSYAINGMYSVARTLPDRETLLKDTNLSKEIGGTQLSFDMLVNNAQFIREGQNENFRKIVMRGGRLRIIFWDYSNKNKSYDDFHNSIGLVGGAKKRGPREAREGGKNLHDALEQIRLDVEADSKKYPGSFEYRINTMPLFYTMWIRDWDGSENKNALGHLSLHFYRAQSYWPSFRVSSRDGKELLDNMHEEFEYVWVNSITQHNFLID